MENFFLNLNASDLISSSRCKYLQILTILGNVHSIHSIVDYADYADDIALMANAPAQAKTLLHSLKWAAAGCQCQCTQDRIYVL